MQRIRTFFFLTFLTVILVLLGSIFGKEGMIIALIFALLMNFFSYWFSDRIILALYRCQKVKEDEYPNLFRIVRRLSQTAGLPMPKIYIFPSSTPNAFATGRNPQHSAVAVSVGILQMLSDEEISGVLGHELSHIKNRDVLIATIVATIAGAITFIARMAQWAALLGGRNRERGNPFALIGYLLMAILAPLAAFLVQMAISRSREYLADEKGAGFCGNPLYLARALEKLSLANKRIPMAGVNPATSHLFIVNPFSKKSIFNLFSTHPPIEERIKHLENLRL